MEFLRKFGRRRRKRQSIKHRQQTTADLFLRTLEPRRVLDAAAPWMAASEEVATELQPGEIHLDAGHGADDGTPDVFRVEETTSGGERFLQVSVNEQVHTLQPLPSALTIDVQGSADDDTLIIDAGVSADLQVNFHGGGPSGGSSADRLVVLNPDDDSITDVSHLIFNNGSGRIDVGSHDHVASVDYEGIESIDDQVVAEARTFEFSGDGIEQIRLADNDEPADGQSVVRADSGPVVTFRGPTESLRIEADDAGANTILVDGLDSRFSADVTIAGDAHDEIQFTSETDFGAGSLRATAGRVQVIDTISSSGEAIELHAVDEITIEETGRIVADGEVSMTAPALNHFGSIESQHGVITLDAGETGTLIVSGSIDASTTSPGQIGGTIHLLGDRVALVDNARLDASGPAGGGTILVGGGYQGKNSAIHNATRTSVEDGVFIAADARNLGRGGTVIIWSDQRTDFYGHITIRGGERGGDGGFAEVSGKDTLVYRGLTDALASKGSAGTLLLDPKNITVDDSGAATQLNGVDDFNDGGFSNDRTIDKDTINLAFSNVILRANNDITVAIDGEISMLFPGVSLTMEAGRSISINANITTNGGNITLDANTTGADSGNRDAGNAVIAMAVGTTLSTGAGGGDITLRYADGTDGDNATGAMQLQTLTAGTGTITVETEANEGGSASLETITIASVTSAGSFVVENSSGVTVTGSLNAATVDVQDTTGTVAFQGNTTISTALVTANQGYSISFTGSTNSVAGDTTFANTGGVTLGNGAGDSITFTGGLDTMAGMTSIAGTVITTNTQIDLGATTMTADATIRSGTAAINVGSITDGAGNFSLDLQNAAATGAVTFAGAVTVNDLDTFAGNYAVAFHGGGTIGTDTTFNNTGGVTLGNGPGDSITFTGGLDTTAGTTSIAGTVTTTNTQIDLGATTMTADAAIRSGSGAINVASITDGAGNFSLDLQNAAATGAVTFAGAVTVNDLDTFAGNYAVAFHGGGTIDTDTTFANTGGVLLGNGAGDSITFTGGLDTTAGTTSIAGTVTTTNTQIDLGATTMTADAAIRSGSGAINVASITDGAGNFSLDLQNAAATGAVTFAGAVTVNDLDTFAGNYAVAFHGGGTIDTDTTFANTGGVILGNGPGDSITFTGGLDTTAGTTSIAGTVTTTNTQIDLGATTMTTDAAIRSGSGAINVASITDGAGNFSLDLQNAAATGAVTFAGAVTVNDLDTFAGNYAVAFHGGGTIDTDTTFANTGGVLLGNGAGDSITFTGGLDTTAGTTSIAGTVATTNTQIDLGATTMTADAAIRSGSGAINVASITDGAGNFSLDLQNAAATGAVTFAGAVTVNDLDTFAGNYAVAFHGGGTIGTDTTFNNTGGVTLGNGPGDSITFTGGLDTTAGTTSIAGTVITTNTQIDLGATTMTTDAAIRGGSGAINVASITDGAGNFSLDLQNAAATGAVTFAGAVTVNDLDTFAGNYAVAFHGGGTIGTDTTFNNTGGVTLGNGALDFITFTAGVNSVAGTTNLAGTVQASANNAVMVFAGTTVTQDATLIASEINFSGGINSVTGVGRSITLRPAANAVSILVGGPADSDANVLEITDSDIAALAGGFSLITIGDSISDDTESITIDTTGASFGDAVTLNASSGTATVTINGQLDTIADVDAGAITINGTGSTTTVSADILTDGGGVTINDAVEVDGSVTIDTHGVGMTAADITINGSIQAKTGVADILTLDADASADGDVEVTGDVAGANQLNAFTVRGAQIDLQSVLVTAGSILISGANIDLNGTSYSIANAADGDDTIAFDGPVDLHANVSVTGGGTAATDTVTFGGTVRGDSDGTRSLSIAAGSGNVTMQDAVGGSNLDLATFTIVSANDVAAPRIVTQGGSGVDTIDITATGDLTVAGVLSTAGGGAAVDSGNINIDLNDGTPGDVVLTAHSTFLTDGVTPTDGNVTIAANQVISSPADQFGLAIDVGTSSFDASAVTFTNLDHLEVRAATATLGATSVDDGEGNAGHAIQVVAANINLNGSLTTNVASLDGSGDVLLDGNVALGAGVTIDTAGGMAGADGGGADGDVLVTGTINNAQTLDINAGGADVNLQSAVGDAAPLAGFTIADANQVGIDNVFVTNGGISVNGVNIDLNGTAYQTNTSGGIAFAGPVDLHNDVTVNAGGSSNVTFSSIDADLTANQHSLTVEANGGSIGVSGFIGSSQAPDRIDFDAAAIGVRGIRTGDGSTGGDIGIELTADNGNITFNYDSATALDASAETSAGSVYISATGGVLVLDDTSNNGNVEFSISGANVTVAAEIQNAATDSKGNRFVINAESTSTVDLQGNLGSATTALGSFTVNTAGTVNLQSAFTEDGGIRIGNSAGDRVTQLNLNGNLQTDSLGPGQASGNIDLFADAVRLQADGSGVAGTIALDSSDSGTGADGEIVIVTGGGSLTSATAFEDGLTLDAGTAGVDVSGATLAALDHLDISAASATLNDVIVGDGAGNPDGNKGIDVVTTGDLTLHGNLKTDGEGASGNSGSVNFSVGGSILLAGNVEIDTDVAGAGNDADIVISAEVQGTGGDRDFTLTAGKNNVQINGPIATDIGTFVASGELVEINAAVTAQQIELSGLDSSGDGDGFTGEVSVAAVTLTVNGDTASNTGQIVFSTDNVTLAGGASLTAAGGGNQQVVFRGEDAASSIRLGAAAAAVDLELTETGHLDHVATAVEDVVIGVVGTQTGSVTVNDATNDGAVKVDNTNLIVEAGMANVVQTATGAIDINGAGHSLTINGQGATTTLAASIDTDSGTVTINDAVLLAGDAVIRTNNTGGGANVSIQEVAGNGGTVDSTTGNSFSLTIDAGSTGDVRVVGAVGATDRPSELAVDARDVDLAETVSVAGDMTVSNSGALTVGGKITATGAVLFDGTGGITLGADIQATDTGSSIAVNDSVLTLTGDRQLQTNNGDILLDEVRTDAADTNVLTLLAGTGNVTVDDNVGADNTELAGLTVVSATNVHFSGPAATLDVNALTVTNASGEVRLDAAANVDGSVDINTATLDLNAPLTTTADGTVTVTNTGVADLGAKITSEGTVLFDGTGGITLGADIQATDAGSSIAVNDSVLTLTGDRQLQTNNGNILLDEVRTDAADTNVLTLQAGTGNVTVDDNVGLDNTELAGLTVVSATDVTFSGPAATLDVDALTVTNASGEVRLDAAANVDGSVDINTATLDLNAPLTTTADGTVTVTNTGVADLGAKITSAGTVLFDGTGGINLDADVQATDAGSSIAVNDSVLTLTGDRQLQTNNGNILLDEVRTDAADMHVLTLQAGTGNVTVDGNVGVDNTELAGLTVVSATDVTFSGPAATLDVNALTVTNASGEVRLDAAANVDGSVDINTATLDLNAPLTTTADGTVTVTNTGLADLNAKILSEGTVLFDGTGGITLGADIQTTDTGSSIAVNDSVLTLTGDRQLQTNNGDILLDEVRTDAADTNVLTLLAGTGNVTVDDNVGVDNTELAGLTVVSATNVHFSGPAATLDVDALTVTNASGEVRLDAAANVDGSVDVNTATLDLNAALTTTADGTVTVTNTGVADLGAKVTSEGTVLFDGTGGITLGADIQTTDTGSSIVVNDSVLTLTGDRQLQTNNGDILLDEVRTDAADTNVLTLLAGTGNVTVDDNVGVDNTELAGLTVVSATNVHFSGPAATLDVDALTVTNASGEVRLDAAANVDGSVDVNTATLDLNAALTTTADGTVTVTNTGVADLGAKVTSEGTVLFDGTGGITLGADIQTTDTGSSIAVNDSVLTLTGDRQLQTNNGDILLDEVRTDAAGTHVLSITAGTGQITVDDNVGVNGGNVLGGLTIESAGNAHFSGGEASIDVASLLIGNTTAVSAAVEFDASVNVSGVVEIDTALLKLDAVLATTAGDPITISANDVELNVTTGAINSGVASTSITDSDGSGIGLGDTPVAGGLNLSGAELQRITATGLTLMTDGDVMVDNIMAANSNNISDTLLLDAGEAIGFSNGPSTFNALSAEADDGITVNVDLTTDVGFMSLDGDADGNIDGADKIQFADGVTLRAATELTLDSSTGKMNAAGTVTFIANSGVTINDSLTGSGLITVDADFDADGVGVYTQSTGAAVDSGGFDIQIVSSDIVLEAPSGITATGASIVLLPSTSGRIVGLGSPEMSPLEFDLTNTEANLLVANTLIIGQDFADPIDTGEILVGEINLTTVDTLILRNSFEQPAGVFAGIRQAPDDSGVDDVTVQGGNGALELQTSGTIDLDTNAAVGIANPNPNVTTRIRQKTGDVVLSRTTLAGNLRVTSVEGSITQVGRVSVGGTTTLTAAESIDLTDPLNDFNSLVSSNIVTGDARFVDANDIILTDVDTFDGLIDVVADGTIAAERVVSGNNSNDDTHDIVLTAAVVPTADILVEVIEAAGNADVILTAEDDILDTDSADGKLLAADDLTAVAKSQTSGDGQASGLVLDTTVATLTATVGDGAHDGDLDVDETDGITLSDVSTFNGSIDVVADGTLTAMQVASINNGNDEAHDVHLAAAVDAAADILVRSVTAVGNADVELTAEDDILDTDSSDGNLLAADDLTAVAKSQTSGDGQASGLVLDTTVATLTATVGDGAHDGDLDVDETDGITLSDVSTFNGSIDVVADGTLTAMQVASINDGDDEAHDVRLTAAVDAAADILVRSITAVGNADAELTAEDDILDTDSADGNLLAADDLTAVAKSQTSGDGQASGLVLDTTVATLTATVGDGAHDGDLDVDETDGITLSNVSTFNGSIDVVADGTLGAMQVASTNDGDDEAHDVRLTAAVDAAADILVRSITAVGNADAELTAEDDILDTDSSDGNLLAADDLTAVAKSQTSGDGQASGLVLDTTVATLTATVGDGAHDGDLDVDETDGITLSDVSTFNGSIDVVADGTLTAMQVASTNDGDDEAHDVRLTAAVDAAADILVGSITAVGNADVELTAEDDILDTDSSDGNLLAADDLTAVAKSQTSGDGQASGLVLDTTVATLTATVGDGAHDGDLDVDETDGITLSDVSTFNGSIDVVADGTLTAMQVESINNGNDESHDVLLTAAVDAAADILVGSITAVGNADVELTAEDDILDTDSTDGNLLSADDLTAVAKSQTSGDGQASGLVLDTTVATLTATVGDGAHDGDLDVDETDGITLSDVSTFNGSIDVVADGTLRATQVVSSNTGDDEAHDIRLTADVVPTADILVRSVTAVGNADVELTAEDDILDTDSADGNLLAADDLTAVVKSQTSGDGQASGLMLDTTVATLTATVGDGAHDGDLDVDETDGITLSDVSTFNGSIDVVADGTLTAMQVASSNDGDDEAHDIRLTADVVPTADILVRSVTAVGNADVELTAEDDILDTDSADGNLLSADDLTAVTKSQTSGDGQASGLVLDTTVATLTATVGDGAHDGDVDVDETDGITLNDVSTFNGSIDVVADGTLTAMQVESSNDGDDEAHDVRLTATVDAAADILVRSVTAVGNADVELTAEDDILDTDSADGNLLAADDLTAVAKSQTSGDGQASGLVLDTTVTTLTATVGDGAHDGDLDVDETDGITLSDVSTFNGSIDVVADGTLTAMQVESSNDGDDEAHDIRLTADVVPTADILVRSVTAVGNADVELTAEDDILDTDSADGNLLSADDLTAVAKSQTSGDGQASGLMLDTTVATLTATVGDGAHDGDLDVDETDGITLSDVSTFSGSIDVVADGTLRATQVVSSNTGDDEAHDIRLTADVVPTADILVRSVTAVGNADVELTAEDDILDTDSADGNLLAADNLTAVAKSETSGDGQASGLVLDTTVATLTATVGDGAHDGDVDVDETDGITLNDVSTFNGSIDVVADGTLTAMQVESSNDGDDEAHDVRLTATVDAAADILVRSVTAVGNADVELTAEDDILDTDSADGNLLAADDLTAVAKSQTSGDGQASGLVLDTTVTTLTATVGDGAHDGDLDVDETDGITLSDVSTFNGSIDVVADGTLTAMQVESSNDGDDEAHDIRLTADVVPTADILVRSVTAVGNADVELTAEDDILDTDSADGNLLSADDLTAVAKSQTSGDGQASGLMLDTTVATLTATVGDGAHDGDVDVDETDGITLSDVSTFNGSIDVVADGTLTATQVESSNDGDDEAHDIRLTADVVPTADILVRSVTAVGNADVELTAEDDILDTDSADGNLLSADDLTAVAKSQTSGDGQASGLVLDTTVATLTATVGDGAHEGDVDVDETDGITLSDVSTFNGSIDVVADGTLTAMQVESSNDGDDEAHDIRLTADVVPTADILVRSVTAVGNADVELTAEDDILDTDSADGNLLAADDLTAVVKSQTSGDGQASGLMLDTTVATLTATVGDGAHDGDLDVDETDGITLSDVSTFNGSIDVVADGTLTAMQVASSNDGDDEAHDIRLTADVVPTADILVRSVTAVGNADVELTAEDDILDTDSADGNLLSADDLTAVTKSQTSGDGQASGLVLDTTVATLTATVGDGAHDGDVDVDETDGITLNDVSTFNGSIDVVADGTLTAMQVESSNDGDDEAHDVRLTATVDAAADILVRSVTAVGNADVELTAEDDILDTDSADGNLLAADDLTAVAKSQTSGDGQASGLVLDTTVTTLTATVGDGAHDGDLDVDETDGITLSDVSTFNGSIDVVADGTLTAMQVESSNDGDDEAHDIRLTADVVPTADILVRSVTAVGNADVELTAEDDILDTDSADGNLLSADDLTAVAKSQTSGDGQASGLMLDTTVATLTATVGDGAHDGDVDVDETDGITLSDVSTFNGSIDVVADGTLTATQVESSNDGDDEAHDIRLTADVVPTADILVRSVTVVGNADVELTAEDDILDTDSADGNLLAADNLTAVAKSETSGDGQASGLVLDTTVTTLTATVGDGAHDGDLDLDETDGITLSDVSTFSGSIDVVADGTLTAMQVASTNDGDDEAHDVRLTAAVDAAADILVGSITAVGNADVELTAEDDILDTDSSDGNLLAADDLTAVAKSQTSGDGQASGLVLDTTVATLTATVGDGAHDGDLDVDETDGITLSDVSTFSGSIDVVADGTLTATQVASTNDGDDEAHDVRLTAAVDAAADILVDSITAVGNADVELTAEDDILDTDSSDGNLLSADDLTAVAKSQTSGDGQASGLVLDTTVATLTATVGGGAHDGDLDVDETDDIVLLDVETHDGPITVFSGGAITAKKIVSDTDHDKNDILLTTSTGNIEVIEISAGLTAGDVTLDSAAAITEDGNHESVLTAHELDVRASGPITLDTSVVHVVGMLASDSGDIDLDEVDAILLSDIQAFDGSISVDAGGAIKATFLHSITDDDANDIHVGTTSGDIMIDVIDAGTQGDVFLVASGGAIVENLDPEADIIANDLVAIGKFGIGKQDEVIELNVDRLEAEAIEKNMDGEITGGGGVFLFDKGDLIIEDISAIHGVPGNGIRAFQSIEIETTGALTVNSDMITTGTLTLNTNENENPFDDFLEGATIKIVTDSIKVSTDASIQTENGSVGDVINTPQAAEKPVILDAKVVFPNTEIVVDRDNSTTFIVLVKDAQVENFVVTVRWSEANVNFVGHSRIEKGKPLEWSVARNDQFDPALEDRFELRTVNPDLGGPDLNGFGSVDQEFSNPESVAHLINLKFGSAPVKAEISVTFDPRRFDGLADDPVVNSATGIEVTAAKQPFQIAPVEFDLVLNAYAGSVQEITAPSLPPIAIRPEPVRFVQTSTPVQGAITRFSGARVQGEAETQKVLRVHVVRVLPNGDEEVVLELGSEVLDDRNAFLEALSSNRNLKDGRYRIYGIKGDARELLEQFYKRKNAAGAVVIEPERGANPLPQNETGLPRSSGNVPDANDGANRIDRLWEQWEAKQRAAVAPRWKGFVRLPQASEQGAGVQPEVPRDSRFDRDRVEPSQPSAATGAVAAALGGALPLVGKAGKRPSGRRRGKSLTKAARLARRIQL